MGNENKKLFDSYFDGELDSRQMIELKQHLESDPELAENFKKELRLHVLLREVANEEMACREKDQSTDSKTSWKFLPSRRMIYSLAASVVLVLGAFVLARDYFKKQGSETKKSSRLVIAEIFSTTGKVMLESGDQQRSVADVSELRQGDILIGNKGSRIKIKYPDGSEIVMMDKTKLAFIQDISGNKIMNMQYGKIEVKVAKQLDGRQMKIATHEAEITVLGTIFSLEATKNSSRLEVSKGLVGIKRLTDGQYLEVPAGYFAIADQSRKFQFKENPSFAAKRKITGPVIAQWNFEETDGRLLYDTSGNDYDLNFGKNINIAEKTTAGKVGRALYFDGDNDEASHLNLLDKMPDELTISCWIKPEAEGMSKPMAFLSKHNKTSSDQMWARCKFDAPGEPGKIGFVFRKKGQYDELYSKKNWVSGKWYFYVVTWDKNSVKLYINGKLQENREIAGGPYADGNTGDFTIGTGSMGTQDFKGTLDELKIYKKALSPQQVEHLYNQVK